MRWRSFTVHHSLRSRDIKDTGGKLRNAISDCHRNPKDRCNQRNDIDYMAKCARKSVAKKRCQTRSDRQRQPARIAEKPKR